MSRPVVARALAAAGAASLLPGCKLHQLLVLQPAGPQADAIRDLTVVFLWVCGVVYVGVMAVLALALLRRRRDPEGLAHGPAVHADELPPEGRRGRADVTPVSEARERRLHRTVGAALGGTLVLLVVLLGANFAASARLTGFRPADPVEIEVVGQQWWWKLRYRHARPDRIFETANELHIPVGRPVLLKLASADVIHSFWVPELHGKRDLIPGQQNTLWLQADKPGLYRGRCAEFCGYQHAHMELLVVAEPPEVFDAWWEAQLRPPPPLTEPLAVRGQHVFLTGPCVMCHAVSGTPAQARLGPDLTHVASRQFIAGGLLANTRGHRAGWILNAATLKPGTRMPSIGLPPDDLHAVLAYLETLR